jgi:hypothetical protein
MDRIRRMASAFLLVTTATLVASGSVSLTVKPARAAGGCRGVDVTPRSNVQKLIDRHPKGTTFCFRRGVYRLKAAIKPRSGDKLIARPGTVLNGSKRLSDFTYRDGRWVASNQHYRVPPSNEQCKRSGYTGCRYAEQVFIDDRPLWQVMSLSELRQGTFFFDYGAGRIFIKNDPRGRKVETSIAPAAIVGSAGYQDRVTVRGFRIEKFASPATGLVAAVKPGNGWVIKGNDIRLNSRLGVYASQRARIQGNRIHHNGMAGIKGQGDYVRVVNNRISSNNIAGFSHSYSGGLRVTSTRGLLVRGNVVKANDGPGLKTDTNNIDVRYERNRVVGNAAPGISHEKSYAATIVGNYLRNNNRSNRGKGIGFGANITLRSSRNVQILRNHVVASLDVNGIGLIDSEAGSGIAGRFELRNVVVRDNVLRMVAGSEAGLVGQRAGSVFTSWGNRFRGNTYHLERPKGQHYQWGGRSLNKVEWRRVGNDPDGSFQRWRR